MKKDILSSSIVEFFHVLVSLGFEPGTSCTLAKGNSSKKLVIIKFHFYVRPNVLEFYIGNYFSVNFPLPLSLEVARLAKVQEVLGSNPGETRT